MGSKATSDFRRRRKENLIKVCGNQCCLCGYHKTQNALEFHHIDPLTKSYGISASGTCHDLDTDLKEIQKCILVCANCHREIHSELYSQEELLNKQIYKEEIANLLKEEKQQILTKTFYYCKVCGKKISTNKGTGLCESCYRNSQRENRPDRDTLKQLIRDLPFTQIGKMYNISDNAIRKWCKTENLPFKKTEILQLTDEQWSKI